MRLQGAIFDMDGTILDSMPAWEHVASDLLRELGREPEPDIDRQVVHLSPLSAARLLRTRYGLPQSADELVALTNLRMERFYREEVRAKPGVEKALSLLKMEGVWMYVATATDRPLAEAALRRTGLLADFRGILTCAEAGADKDDPRIYEKCLTRLRCRKEECVVFEDSLRALRTAKAAGFRTAAVYDDASREDQPALRACAETYIVSFDQWYQTF